MIIFSLRIKLGVDSRQPHLENFCFSQRVISSPNILALRLFQDELATVCLPLYAARHALPTLLLATIAWSPCQEKEGLWEVCPKVCFLMWALSLLHEVRRTKMQSARAKRNNIATAKSNAIGKRGSHHR
jgi:hypothetical protein